ncbi:MAG TPA: DUF2914 domain-containing protein [bacterium]|nr:DUF2914 domain-containing protein [bacterium]
MANCRYSIILTIIGALFLAGLSEQPTAAQTLSDTLYVKSFVLTTDVENHEPVDTVQAFAKSIDYKAFCHARIFNGNGDRTLRFRWIRDGEVFMTRPVTIGESTRFRTYTSIVTEPGRWEVQLLDEQDRILARKAFSILEATVQSER